jgi:glycosyltransferase involved in cell wall biosynthesis
MNISVCITVLNEENSIARLLESLLAQTKKPKEIIIVDGGSSDRTIEVIKHYQKKDKRIKLLTEKCSRSRGRNLGIEIAKGEIIAMTDAGCVPKPDWLEKITASFAVGAAVVAGFYQMKANSVFEKAAAVFLGVAPSDFGPDFLPATRSMAFRKEVWEAVGGFDENLNGAAEDTGFNYKILKKGYRISRVKDARVEWEIPQSLKEVGFKIYEYAKGDAKSKIFRFPGKTLESHNIKAILVFLRYGLGMLLFVLGFNSSVFALSLGILVSLYFFLAWRKAGFWGIILQFVSDLAVMGGFLTGLLAK